MQVFKSFNRLRFPQKHSNLRLKTYSYDPFYISRKPSIPSYPRLQFYLTSYDFPTLESFERYVSKISKRWTDSVDSFPLPPKKILYKVYHHNSDKIKTEFDLNKYCRVIRLENIKTVDLPIIFDLVQQNLPEGVELAVKEFDSQLEEERYVANLEIQTLQEELSKLTTK